MKITRDRALTVLVECITNWPLTDTQMVCNLKGWDWATVPYENEGTYQVVLMGDDEGEPITENDWLAGRGEPVNEPTPTIDLYTMALHDELQLGESTAIRRVPGGWVYYVSHPSSNHTTSTFVPYHEEFFQ